MNVRAVSPREMCVDYNEGQCGDNLTADRHLEDDLGGCLAEVALIAGAVADLAVIADDVTAVKALMYLDRQNTGHGWRTRLYPIRRHGGRLCSETLAGKAIGLRVQCVANAIRRPQMRSDLS